MIHIHAPIRLTIIIIDEVKTKEKQKLWTFILFIVKLITNKSKLIGTAHIVLNVFKGYKQSPLTPLVYYTLLNFCCSWELVKMEELRITHETGFI